MTNPAVQVRARWLDGRMETLNSMDSGVETQEIQGLGEDGQWYSFRHSGEIDSEEFLIFVQGPDPVTRIPPPSEVAVLSAQCFTCAESIEIHANTTRGFGAMEFYAVECPHCSKLNDIPLPGDIVGIFKASDSR
jgi:hypothetical protein